MIYYLSAPFGAAAAAPGKARKEREEPVKKEVHPMSKAVTLKVEMREHQSKGTIKSLRKAGFVPGSISHKGSDAVSITLKRDELIKALQKNSLSTVFNLKVDSKNAYDVLVREIQYAPLTREMLHVTFQQISLTEETTADIEIHAVGKDGVIHRGLELLQHLGSLAVRGLPGDFPGTIDVDVSKMEAGDQVTVADLKLPKGIVSEDEPEKLILAVSHPKAHAEAAAPAESAETAAEPAAEAKAEETEK